MDSPDPRLMQPPALGPVIAMPEVEVSTTIMSGGWSEHGYSHVTATALLHGATLVTADDRILAWSGTLQRHDARQ
jgi:hypothetical protein